MCLACYKTIPPPPVAPRARPSHTLPAAYQQSWQCYPVSGAVQMVPPPPIILTAASPTPAAKKKKVKKSRPSLPAGATYIYPVKHTCVHVIRDVQVWTEAEQDFTFKIHQVPTSLSVTEFMEAICGGSADDAKGMVCTEVKEMGDGVWQVEGTYEFGGGDDEKMKETMKGTLSGLGWDERRGAPSGRPPVWVVIHKK